jgi:ribonuclease P protein component
VFSRKYRIKASEINKVFSEKVKTEHSDAFFVKKKENDFGHDRFATIVPKKVCKTAVSRHRNKRIFTSLLKDVLENTPDETIGNDFIFTLKKDISKFSDEEKNKIENQITKII